LEAGLIDCYIKKWIFEAKKRSLIYIPHTLRM
jgi:hypothetical protein